MEKIRLCLIAPLTSHAAWGRVAALSFDDAELSVIDTSRRASDFNSAVYPFLKIANTYKLYDLSNCRNIQNRLIAYMMLIIESLRARCILPENVIESNRIMRLVGMIRPHVIYLHYGPDAIRMVRILKRLKISAKIVLIINLLPSALISRNKLKRPFSKWLQPEFINYKRWLKFADLCITSSSQMNEFIVRRFDYDINKLVIAPDYNTVELGKNTDYCSPVKSKLNNDLQQSKYYPRLIFLGAPERWGLHSGIDNADNEFKRLLDASIYIESGALSNELKSHPLAKEYDYFTTDEILSGYLSKYASSFDGALVFYNNTEHRERFRSTLPTRFFTAISSGIPIIVKRCGLEAVERYVLDHNIGFVYDEPLDIIKFFSSPTNVSVVKRNAQDHRNRFNAETQQPLFRDISFKAKL